MQPEPSSSHPASAVESAPPAPLVVSTVKPLVPAHTTEMSRMPSVMPRTWTISVLPTNVTLAKIGTTLVQCRRISAFNAASVPRFQKPHLLKK